MAPSTVIFSRAQLFGHWYRSDTDGQGQQFVEHAQINEDGSYEFNFVTQDVQGQVIEQVIELGDWGLVGDIHFTFTKSEVIEQEMYAADLNDADNYHAYKVLQLTHQTFQYQHLLTGEIFIMHRVVDEVGHC